MKGFNKTHYLGRLGRWVATLRKSRELGQDQVSELAGLAKGTLSKIEQGQVDPQASTLVRVAGALKLPSWKIFDVPALAEVPQDNGT